MLENVPSLWQFFNTPTHAVEFVGGGHYDYVDGYHCGYGVGACSAEWQLTADVLVTFFSKYMPPMQLASAGASLLDDSLVPPTYSDVVSVLNSFPSIDPEQNKFLAGYMTGRSNYQNAACKAQFKWRTTTANKLNI